MKKKYVSQWLHSKERNPFYFLQEVLGYQVKQRHGRAGVLWHLDHPLLWIRQCGLTPGASTPGKAILYPDFLADGSTTPRTDFTDRCRFAAVPQPYRVLAPCSCVRVVCGGHGDDGDTVNRDGRNRSGNRFEGLPTTCVGQLFFFPLVLLETHLSAVWQH